ncbi:MAG: aminopeptidase N [Microbacteriaceae bacterium]|nr:aminopeptidase N [Microbacteriaceae bacterium]
MPGENLTRVEAIERSSVVRTESYAVRLDLTTSDSTFRSLTTVTFGAEPGASTFIDAITSTVHGVTLNGVSLEPAVVSDGIRIQLDGLSSENVLVVDADMFFVNTGEGLHRFVDPVDNKVYLYSQFEVPDSRRVFAAFEQPDLKATFDFEVVVPSDWVVVSNSPTPTPVVDGASATWTFPQTPRISSYITAIVAGPYVAQHDHLTSSDGRTIPLGIYVRQSLAEFLDFDYIFDITKKGFEYFEREFAVPYPFEKYDQLFVPEFNAGAMENAGCVTFTEVYVFRSKVTDAVRERRVVTILHELAHMWFGDLVTMKWWNDLWLNESFAEWASTIATAEATEWTHAWATFQVSEKSWAYRQDQLPSTHPIVATINDLEDVQINFDGITYAKGGSVLKQLVAYVGRDAFFTGVTNYFLANAWKNAELADLLRELEKTSKRDLATWSAKWLETAGVNTLTPEIVTDDKGIITSFDILQTAVTDYPTIRPHRLAVGIYAFQGSALVRTHRVELDIDGERTTVTDLIGQHRGALVLVNDDDLAYAKIRLDGESLAMAIDHLSDIADPLARALVWGSAWDSTRDAEMAPSDFVDLVLGNIATESESTTVRTTLAQLATTARMYVAPNRRENTIRRVADAMLELAENAEPGSDQQFQFLRTFASMADTAEHAAALRAIRSGERVISGIAIDTDLSWDLLEGMVLAGGADESEITAALAADNTSNGQQAAARLRATIPTAEAKRKILETMRDDATIANSQCDHYVRGYTHVNDPSVFENLVSEYFDAVQTVWDSRTFKIAEYFAIGLYPSVMATESLGSMTRAWLASNKAAPSALRRIVIEGLATVDRALAAQRRDAEVIR